MTNLLTWNFWFSLNPDPLTPLNEKIFIGIIIAFIALTIFILIIKRNGGIYRGFLNRLYNFYLGNSVIGLILFFFNYELVPFFSARFWLALWFIIMITWFGFILKKLKVIPIAKKEQEQAKEMKKYLP